MYVAELRSKLSLEGSTPADRLEDTLTAAVFGALRYLPREVLCAVLNRAFPGDFTQADMAATDFEFWPWLGDVEPDLLLTVGRKVVVVEAKYGTPVGGAGGDYELHQLVREYRAGEARSRTRKQSGPWLLAVTSDWAEPQDIAQTRQALKQTSDGPVNIAWLSWQSIAAELGTWQPSSEQERDLRSDVLKLMDRRGVRHVFDGFREEDYWIVSAAQRVAAERVYPTIATFARQLNERVGEEGLRWGPNDQGVINYHSMSLQYPKQWARSYIALQYWAEDWPPRKGFWATLHVMFDFVNGNIRVGYLQKVPSVSAAKKHWLPKAQELASALTSLPQQYEVSFSNYNYARSRVTLAASQVTAEMITEQVQRTPSANLRIERSLEVRELHDVGQALAILAEVKKLVDANPVVFSVILPAANEGLPPVSPAEPGDAPD